MCFFRVNSETVFLFIPNQRTLEVKEYVHYLGPLSSSGPGKVKDPIKVRNTADERSLLGYSPWVTERQTRLSIHAIPLSLLLKSFCLQLCFSLFLIFHLHFPQALCLHPILFCFLPSCPFSPFIPRKYHEKPILQVQVKGKF